MDDSFRDSSKELMNHNRLVILWDRIKRLLNHMAAEGIHRKVQSISPNSLGNFDDLLGCSMLKASLNEKVSKPVHHQGVRLSHDSLDYIVLLLRSTDLEFLLQENRRLLIVVADDLVNNILPVAVHVTIQQSTIVERLGRGQISWSLWGYGLFLSVRWQVQ